MCNCSFWLDIVFQWIERIWCKVKEGVGEGVEFSWVDSYAHFSYYFILILMHIFLVYFDPLQWLARQEEIVVCYFSASYKKKKSF